MTDYYQVLGVSPDADDDDIRRAYRAKIATVHPDKPGGDAEQARALDEARQVLLDPLRRAEYDARSIGDDLVDEAITALTIIGERAVERLGKTVQVRGRQLLAKLRRRKPANARR